MPRHLLPAFLLLIGGLLPALADAPPPSAPDLLPLEKALAPLDGDAPLKSRTTIFATGSRQGLSFTLHEALRITAYRPGKFHVQVTQLGALGQPKTFRVTVISDGKRVWTYRPGLHQYSVTSFQAFEGANNDVPTLGLIVGGLYFGDGHAMVHAFRSITSGNSTDILAELAKLDITISRHAESAAGQDDYVYDLVMTKQKLTYQFYVNSETNTLTRVSLASSDDDLQITFREDVTRVEPVATLPKSTFAFTPPLGTSKAKTVSVVPF